MLHAGEDLAKKVGGEAYMLSETSAARLFMQ